MRDRAAAPICSLIPQPTPGAREIRFRPPRAHTDHRPREEKPHV